MNKNIYEAIQTRKKGAIIKHKHMFDIYDSHLRLFQNSTIKLLEIGVYNAGSLYMWRSYFPNSTIIGIDIDEWCEVWEDTKENVFVEIGDQSDAEFLKRVNEKHGPFDIIIDDGGHENYQTITAFEVLFPLLKNNGIYLIEDTYTSYWPDFSCAKDTSISGNDTHIIKKESKITKMDFFKSLVDKLNVWAYKEGGEGFDEAGHFQQHGPMDVYEENMFSLHFYDGMCVMQKFKRNGIKPFSEVKWYEHPEYKQEEIK